MQKGLWLMHFDAYRKRWTYITDTQWRATLLPVAPLDSPLNFLQDSGANMKNVKMQLMRFTIHLLKYSNGNFMNLPKKIWNIFEKLLRKYEVVTETVPD